MEKEPSSEAVPWGNYDSEAHLSVLKTFWPGNLTGFGERNAGLPHSDSLFPSVTGGTYSQPPSNCQAWGPLSPTPDPAICSAFLLPWSSGDGPGQSILCGSPRTHFCPDKEARWFCLQCDDRLGGRFAECCHRCREPSAHISSPTENQHLCPLTYPSGSLQVPSWFLILWKERKHRDFLSFVQDM